MDSNDEIQQILKNPDFIYITNRINKAGILIALKNPSESNLELLEKYHTALLNFHTIWSGRITLSDFTIGYQLCESSLTKRMNLMLNYLTASDNELTKIKIDFDGDYQNTLRHFESGLNIMISGINLYFTKLTAKVKTSELTPEEMIAYHKSVLNEQYEFSRAYMKRIEEKDFIRDKSLLRAAIDLLENAIDAKKINVIRPRVINGYVDYGGGRCLVRILGKREENGIPLKKVQILFIFKTKTEHDDYERQLRTHAKDIRFIRAA